MQKRNLLLITFLTSPYLACSHSSPNLKMLEDRANYEEKEMAEESSLNLSDILPEESSGNTVVRTAPKTANIWIFPHETPSKEYFWGGWLSVVVEGDKWDLERPHGLDPIRPLKPSQKGSAKANRGTND